MICDLQTPAEHLVMLRQKNNLYLANIIGQHHSLVPLQMSIFRNNDMKIPACHPWPALPAGVQPINDVRPHLGNYN